MPEVIPSEDQEAAFPTATEDLDISIADESPLSQEAQASMDLQLTPSEEERVV